MRSESFSIPEVTDSLMIETPATAQEKPSRPDDAPDLVDATVELAVDAIVPSSDQSLEEMSPRPDEVERAVARFRRRRAALQGGR